MKRYALTICILSLLSVAALLRAQATTAIYPTPTPPPRPAPLGAAQVIVDHAAPLSDAPIAYGVNGWWTDQDARLWQARYAELGPKIVRVPLIHQLLEPNNDDDDPGHTRWDGFWFDKAIPRSGRTITYRRWFETLRDLDVTLMLHAPHLAGWLSANGDQGVYSTYPPTSAAEYGEFIQAALTFLVDELDYPPHRIILEPVNEPDLRCGQDQAVPCFWDNWTMDDLLAVLQAARQAADAVDPAIRLAGLSTCCDHYLLTRLMQDHDGATLLDGLTFHHYERGFDQTPALQAGAQLQTWGLPVYLNEYGSPKYWSDGQAGALWHAAALAQIWPAGIVPVQFSISEFPDMHAGYNQLGLFADWTNGWQTKPAYAVYVGFARHLGAGVPVSTTAQAPLLAAAGQIKNESLTLWIVNADQSQQPGVIFHAINFPADRTTINVYDVLAGPEPIDNFALAGRPLAWAYDLPAGSVYAFELDEPPISGWRRFLITLQSLYLEMRR